MFTVAYQQHDKTKLVFLFYKQTIKPKTNTQILTGQTFVNFTQSMNNWCYKLGSHQMPTQEMEGKSNQKWKTNLYNKKKLAVKLNCITVALLGNMSGFWQAVAKHFTDRGNHSLWLNLHDSGLCIPSENIKCQGKKFFCWTARSAVNVCWMKTQVKDTGGRSESKMPQ